MTTTLSVDCGGGGIKAGVLDASGAVIGSSVRVPTPYPLPTDLLLDTLVDLAGSLPAADRVTVGLPGMVRHGVVVETPHYVTDAGPGTQVLDHLVDQWHGFDARAAIRAALARPVIVLNDAEVHAAGAITGVGLEVVLTLGTGLGCAWTDGGRLAPHLELSQAPVTAGVTHDDHLGELARQQVGDGAWSTRVRTAIAALRPVFAWDRLYLGGGNAALLDRDQVAAWGTDVQLIPNATALLGGVRAWDLGFG